LQALRLVSFLSKVSSVHFVALTHLMLNRQVLIAQRCDIPEAEQDIVVHHHVLPDHAQIKGAFGCLVFTCERLAFDCFFRHFVF